MIKTELKEQIKELAIANEELDKETGVLIACLKQIIGIIRTSTNEKENNVLSKITNNYELKRARVNDLLLDIVYYNIYLNKKEATAETITPKQTD